MHNILVNHTKTKNSGGLNAPPVASHGPPQPATAHFGLSRGVVNFGKYHTRLSARFFFGSIARRVFGVCLWCALFFSYVIVHIAPQCIPFLVPPQCTPLACTPVHSASSARLWCAPQCTVHAFGVHLIPSAPQCTPLACTQVHSARLRRAPHFQCTPVHAFGVHSISSALQCTPSACTPMHSARRPRVTLLRSAQCILLHLLAKRTKTLNSGGLNAQHTC